jgi:DNA-binding NarL/FixJ family response regulator
MNLIALVVEDQKMMAELYRNILTRIADKVFVANDLASAMKIVREQDNLHLVTLDLNMPNSTTAEVLSSIELIHAKHPNCAVVILTGDESESIRRDASGYAADDFVLKNDVASSQMMLQVILCALAKRAKGDPEITARLDELVNKLSQLKA